MQSFTDVLPQIMTQSFAEVWFSFANFLPLFVIGVIILVAGWLIGSGLARLTSKLATSFGVDDALSAAGVDEFLERGGYNLRSAGLLGALVKWFVFLVALVIVFDVLGLSQVNLFLSDVVLGFLPQVIVAAVILLIAALIAEAVHKFVMGAGKSVKVGSPAVIAAIARAAVWVFALLAALNQLGIAQELVQLLFGAIVFGFALAFGLAFGLGGRESAARTLERIEKSFTK